LLPKRIIGRFHFVRNAEEASKYISIDAIPEGLGGKMVIVKNNFFEILILIFSISMDHLCQMDVLNLRDLIQMDFWLQ